MPKTIAGCTGPASAQKTSWRVERTTSPQPASPLRLGDEVYLRSMNDSGATYLANNGDTVTFTIVTGAPPTTVKWRLDTTDAVRYPVGMPIEIGKTPVILTNYLSTPPTGVPPSTARRLKSQGGNLRNLTGASTDAVWKLGWACISGDVCQ